MNEFYIICQVSPEVKYPLNLKYVANMLIEPLSFIGVSTCLYHVSDLTELVLLEKSVRSLNSVS